MQISFLQSQTWQEFQNALKIKNHREKTTTFEYLALEKTTPFGKYLYLPYGPVYNSEKGLKDAIKSLKSLAKTTSAFFIRIEPTDAQNAQFLQNTTTFDGLHIKKTKNINPAETWVVDLAGSNEEFKKRLPSRLLRYHKNAEKTGISIRTSKNPDDIKLLLSLQKKLAKKKNINTFSEQYLKTQLEQNFATLYLVEKDQTTIAAGLVFDDKTTRYNIQGAQDEDARKFHATGILTIQLINDAREKGLKIFDFWGIAPEGAPKNHPWAGFTAFKKTFTGQEKIYCGDYDLILNKPKYTLYNIVRKINLFIRKIK